MIRRELLNARVYFIPAGEVVDSVTVTATAWPDASPATNWTAYQLQDTETLVLERTFDTEVFPIPKASGGYTDDEENTLKKVTYTGTTAKTSSIFKMLELLLLTEPVVGVAQSPFVRNDDYVEGVTFLELQNKSGAVVQRTQFWSRLRLSDPGTVGPTTKKLTYTVELRDSASNTTLAVA
jgi:hypothetical protein